MDWLTVSLIVVGGLVLVIGFLVLLAVIALIFGRKELQKRIFKFLKPNPQDIQDDLHRLSLKFPGANPDEMASAYVKDQAKFLALVGFVTEIPLLGSALDISYTTLRQMRMLHVIAAIYGNNRLDPEQLEIKSMAVVGGASAVGRILVKAVTGEIPVLSGFINCGLNWFITNRIGEIGIGWNKEQSIWTTAKGTLEETKRKAIDAKDEAVNKVNSFRGQSNIGNSSNAQTGQEEVLVPQHK